MRDRRRPRRSCSIPRPAASWPRTTRAPRATRWRRRGSACSALADQVGNRPVQARGRRPARPGNWSAPTWAPARLQRDLVPTPPGRPTSTPSVDTIFEIGGQDSKYIYLRNGVPIDYAMNNACSAGTGSFLEESARAISASAWPDIADVALAAPAPVQFKATCAAFINSDIRIAQQQGYSRENIVAGLVVRDRGQLPQPGQGPALRGQEGVPAGRRRPEPRGRPRLRPQRRPPGRDPTQPGVARGPRGGDAGLRAVAAWPAGHGDRTCWPWPRRR